MATLVDNQFIVNLSLSMWLIFKYINI